MNPQNLIDEIVAELYKKLQQDVKLTSPKKKVMMIGKYFSDEAKRLEEIYDIVSYQGGNSQCECIVICQMTVGLLAHLALGCSGTEEEEFILKHLLEGKKVYMLEEGIAYRTYKKTSYKALYTLYSEYEDKIKQYGIRTIGNVMDILVDKENGQRSALQENKVCYGEEIDFTHKKLLLESDLMKAHIPALVTILVDKKSIVTPLADDFIRTHKLKIKRV
ncbi:MAG: hypothetical protein RR324_00140 [Cellulosilyticaceae bacterium]